MRTVGHRPSMRRLRPRRTVARISRSDCAAVREPNRSESAGRTQFRAPSASSALLLHPARSIIANRGARDDVRSGRSGVVPAARCPAVAGGADHAGDGGLPEHEAARAMTKSWRAKCEHHPGEGLLRHELARAAGSGVRRMGNAIGANRRRNRRSLRCCSRPPRRRSSQPRAGTSGYGEISGPPPGIQKSRGHHGITLMDPARAARSRVVKISRRLAMQTKGIDRPLHRGLDRYARYLGFGDGPKRSRSSPAIAGVTSSSSSAGRTEVV